MQKLESSDEIPEVNHEADNSDIRNEKESKSSKEDSPVFGKYQDSIDDNYMDKAQEESVHLNKCRSECKALIIYSIL